MTDFSISFSLAPILSPPKEKEGKENENMIKVR